MSLCQHLSLMDQSETSNIRTCLAKGPIRNFESVNIIRFYLSSSELGDRNLLMVFQYPASGLELLRLWKETKLLVIKQYFLTDSLFHYKYKYCIYPGTQHVLTSLRVLLLQQASKCVEMIKEQNIRFGKIEF